MTVKQSEETKTFLIYETVTHRFKISEDALDKMQEKKGFQDKLSTLIQKNMKQTIDSCSGEMWENSAQEIFSAITKQKSL